MTGIKAGNVETGVQLSVDKRVAHPFTTESSDTAHAGVSEHKEKANEDDYEGTYKEYTTFAEAKKNHPNVGKKITIEDGFYHTSISGSTKKQPYNAVIAICNGKKTANLPAAGLKEVGKSCNRLYVGYKDLSDPASAVFVVRTVTRIR